MRLLKEDGALQSGRIPRKRIAAPCTAFLGRLRDALASGSSDVDGPEFVGVQSCCRHVCRAPRRAPSPRETAMFVFSLKPPLFDALQRQGGADAAAR